MAAVQFLLRVLIIVGIVLQPKLLCASSLVCSTGSSYGCRTATSLHKNVAILRWVFEATRSAP